MSRRHVRPFQPRLPFSHTAASRLACVQLVAVLSSSAACHSGSRRDDSTTHTVSSRSSHDETSAQLLDLLAESLCEEYANWPAVTEAFARTGVPSGTGESSETAASTVDPRAVATRAAELCPEVIAPTQVTGRGLPHGRARTTDLVGIFEASTAAAPDETRSRYEWTAIGLGCAAVRARDARELEGFEADFLAAMGFTTESYIQASLQMDDPALSERIFARIHQCAGAGTGR